MKKMKEMVEVRCERCNESLNDNKAVLYVPEISDDKYFCDYDCLDGWLANELVLFDVWIDEDGEVERG